MSLLEIDGATVTYGPVRALDGVSLHVGRGQCVAVVGDGRFLHCLRRDPRSPMRRES